MLHGNVPVFNWVFLRIFIKLLIQKKHHSLEVWKIHLDSCYDYLNNGSVSKNNYE